MKSIILFIIVIVFLISVIPLYSNTDLITVELGNAEKIASWRVLNIPTYEYINGFAIAEIDISQSRFLISNGFDYNVIDHIPWNGEYFISSIPINSRSHLPGNVIWSDDDICLIKISEYDLPLLLNSEFRFQPLKKIVLPDRFWDNLNKKVVFLPPSQRDPFIQSLVDQVNEDSITSYIQRLVDFKTRFIFTDSSYAASEWILQKYSDWGYSTEFDSFWVTTSWPGNGWERNVIATETGTVMPEKIFIACGHFDAIVWTDTFIAHWFAPGADDNATGTVSAMEIARIFKNYSWDKTMQFIAWGSEELGLIGSYHYARRADSLNHDIGGVINADMIGYMDDSNYDIMIQRRQGSSMWFTELMLYSVQTYTPTLTAYSTVSSGGSDWYPFAVHGYDAIGNAEFAGTQFNPFYHDTLDVMSTLTPYLYTETIKASVAAFAILGVYPTIVEGLEIANIGNGTSFQISWFQNPEPDIVGYKIYWFLESQTLPDTQYVSGAATTVDTVISLITDSLYYFGVTAIDNDGYESYAMIIDSGVPSVNPQVPSGFLAIPVDSGIRLNWNPNTELDFAGYRIYRRLNDDTLYDSLNITLYSDTIYTDIPLSGENKYFYTIRAYDTDGNYSEMSEEVYGRPITLDQGILIVDETSNSGGIYPQDSLQDQFYRYILDGYTYTEYDYSSLSEKPVIADLVPYSSVIWHSEDLNDFLADDVLSILYSYLYEGGNIWFSGWKNVSNLSGFNSYPITFSSGDIIHDYFKISDTDLSAISDSFQGANGLNSYPSLQVDPNKVPLPIWGNTIRYIEKYTSVTNTDTIFTMDMANTSSSFQGAPCGIRYLGSDFKVIVLGFPLYYMEQDQVRSVATKVMSDFGEVVGIEEEEEIVSNNPQFMLVQNIPNPFYNRTEINYQIPISGHVSLKIYNIAGQLIQTLVNKTQQSGFYSVIWNGIDNRNRIISNGIYFYQLQSGNYSSLKKMTVLR